MPDTQPAEQPAETTDISFEDAVQAFSEIPDDEPQEQDTEAPDLDTPPDEAASEETTEAPEATEEDDLEAEATEEVEEAESEETEEADSEDEPETPAIDPPASMNAADKAAFAKLPHEQQEFIARREREVAEGFTRKSQELADSQQKFQRELQQTQDAARQAIAQRDRQYQEAMRVLGAQMASTVKVYSQEELAQLRESDPAQWAMASEHNRSVRDTQQQIQHELSRQDQTRQQQAEQARRQVLEQNRQKLPQLIPEWGDAGVARTEGLQVADYLTAKAGFSQQEVNSNADARLLAMARKAWLYDNLQAAKPALTKKVQAAPKTVKPTAATTRKAPADARIDKLGSRFRKTGSLKDAAALLAASEN